MTDPRPQDLHYMNFLVDMMVGAMLGLVTPGLLGVALDFDDHGVKVYFAVREHSARQEKDIEDILTEFRSSLYPQTPEIEVHVSEAYPDEGWIGHRARQVFCMKR